jgi:1,4-alpha-glucan branching enzyme
MLNEKSIEAQVKVACDEYKRFFGRAPRGIWIPECASQKA